ncbi:predicted protein [Plenodomus lingam JN3]|uniref:Predicted protein n=1 Tax=Leptosphaeria maculans (strain JN3 / isolate v23.1.3 / race Av1-4-5-6-7-8) TaxID=985895 RepID=E5ABW5_LEPMJ|nr:predicted protein [Plenodomus lingam JN3]CBY01156.1 predicted protein [Plenodomus lingam JN3]
MAGWLVGRVCVLLLWSGSRARKIGTCVFVRLASHGARHVLWYLPMPCKGRHSNTHNRLKG